MYSFGAGIFYCPYFSMGSIVPISSRSLEVRETINKIKSSLIENLLYLGELLSEVKRENYFLAWGFSGFGEWLETSGLDLKERSAYYLIKIVDTAKQLDIPYNQLADSKISKLKEIFALSASQHGESIKQLVADSAKMSLDEVRLAVDSIKENSGQEKFTWRNFKVSELVATQVIDPAIEQAKAIYGDTINSETGEIEDISDGRALEYICADFSAG